MAHYGAHIHPYSFPFSPLNEHCHPITHTHTHTKSHRYFYSTNQFIDEKNTQSFQLCRERSRRTRFGNQRLLFRCGSPFNDIDKQDLELRIDQAVIKGTPSMEYPGETVYEFALKALDETGVAGASLTGKLSEPCKVLEQFFDGEAHIARNDETILRSFKLVISRNPVSNYISNEVFAFAEHLNKLSPHNQTFAPLFLRLQACKSGETPEPSLFDEIALAASSIQYTLILVCFLLSA